MRRGFSLVELSIVLVILGLLTGGVLVGQDLIRAAELRKIASEAQRYQTATYTFRDKYFALPGDMGNATAFWDTAGGNGEDYACTQIATTDGSTCNGNNNGIIGSYLNQYSIGTPLTTVYKDGGESVRFWQHMANAGLIEGNYTGENHATFTTGIVAGADDGNAPKSPVGASYWMPETLMARVGSTAEFSGGRVHSFLLVPPLADIAGWGFFYHPSADVLKPEETWSLDIKLDDGFPGTGKVQAQKGDCTTASGVAPPGDAGAEYVLTTEDKVCGFRYVF